MGASPRTGTRAMRDTTLRDHLVIVAQLPDFVLGKLDEASLRRVDRHLEICPTCRHELANAMDVLGMLAAVPSPPAWARGAILRRAAAEHPAAVRQGVASGKVISGPSTTGEVGQSPISAPSRRRLMPFGRPVPRWALVASTAAVFLVSGLAGWGYEQRNGNAVIQDVPISTLISDSATAYPAGRQRFAGFGDGSRLRRAARARGLSGRQRAAGAAARSTLSGLVVHHGRSAAERRTGDRRGRRRPPCAPRDTRSLCQLCRGRPYRRASNRKRRPDIGSGARRLVPTGDCGPALLASLIRPSLCVRDTCREVCRSMISCGLGSHRPVRSDWGLS